MERFVYLDIDGNEHCKSEVSLHHVFPRSAMKGVGERRWADLHKVPLLNTYHNMGSLALHTNMELCPKPTKEMMHRIRMEHYRHQESNPYDRFIAVNEYVHHIAETEMDTHDRWLAGRIANNLERQAPFILLGMVTIQELD